MNKLLEVGDVLYIPNKYGRGYAKTTKVTRITPKQAETDTGDKVLREVGRDGYVKKIGYNPYAVNSYRLESEELKKEWEHQMVAARTGNLLQGLPNSIATKEMPLDDLYKLETILLEIKEKYSTLTKQ